jgi:hypothetical protein
MGSDHKSNGKGELWPEVTKDRKCPKCGHDSWCALRNDGAFVRCYRTDDGTGTRKTDSAGNSYTLYRLDGHNRDGGWPEPTHSHTEGGGQRADADTLSRIYGAFLAELRISQEHGKALRARGLTGSLHGAGYRTLGKDRAKACAALVANGLEKYLPGVPGFYVQDKDGHRFWSVAGLGGLVIPVRDVEDRITGLSVRLDDPDTTGGGKYRWVSSRSKGGVGPGAPVHVPRFKGERDRARVTEGALKADVATVLSGVLTIGLPGVAAFKKAAAVLRELGAKVAVVAYDADACCNRHVAEALSRLVRHLRRRGFTVQLEMWDREDGKGIDDLLRGKKQPDLVEGDEAVDSVVSQILKDAREADPPPPPPCNAGANGQGPDQLPRIQGNRRQLRHVTDDALAAVLRANDPPRLFQRGELLTRLRRGHGTRPPRLEVMADHALRGHLGRVANWVVVKTNRDGDYYEEDAPPMEVVKDMSALPGWDGVPYLEALIECPAYGRDGALVDRPGYHPAAMLWYEPAPRLEVPPIPDRPTPEDVEAARKLLLEDLLGDFPFVDDAGKSHALAALLLPFVRQLIDGPTPLHLFDAPTEGTGKTLLCSCIAMVATGRPIEAMTESKCEEEWRKRLTATLAEGPTFILLDNLSRVLDSASLASALTCRVWKDRVLGVSKTAVLPNVAVWLASGNNSRLSRELIRRTILTRLDAKTDVPWERTGFRHPNLLE